MAHPLKCTYSKMIDRCHNPKHVYFRNYGGRGISVCEEWRGDGGFERWLDYVGPKPSPKHTLDRVDNNRGYEPGNVRWATATQQQRNRRDARMLVAGEVKEHLCDAADRLGISESTMTSRLAKGWSIDRLLATPVAKTERLIEFNGETLNVAQWADRLGIARQTLLNRLDLLQWPVERAMTTGARPMKRSGRPRKEAITLSLNGVTKTRAQWAKELGVSDSAISARIKLGWSMERALTTPPGPSGPKKSPPK